MAAPGGGSFGQGLVQSEAQQLMNSITPDDQILGALRAGIVPEATNAGYDLFSLPAKQVTVNRTTYETISPSGVGVGALAQQTLSFDVNPATHGYVNLAKSYFTYGLDIRMNLVIDAGTAPISTLERTTGGDNWQSTISAMITKETNFDHLLIRSLRTSLSQVDVSDATENLYGVASFYTKLLTKSANYARGTSANIIQPRTNIENNDFISRLASTTVPTNTESMQLLGCGAPVGFDSQNLPLTATITGNAYNPYFVGRSPTGAEALVTSHNLSHGVLTMTSGVGASEAMILCQNSVRRWQRPILFPVTTAGTLPPATNLPFWRGPGICGPDWDENAGNSIRCPHRSTKQISFKYENRIAADLTPIITAVATVTGKIYPDAGIWRQDRRILPSVPIRVTIDKAADELVLHVSKDLNGSVNWFGNVVTLNPNLFHVNPSISWDAPNAFFNLHICREYVTEPFQEALTAKLLREPAMYPIVRARAMNFRITGLQEINQPTLFNGVRPDLVVVAFHAKDAVTGNYADSPFYTAPFITPMTPDYEVAMSNGYAAAAGGPPMYSLPSYGRYYQQQVPSVSEISLQWGGRSIPDTGPYKFPDESGVRGQLGASDPGVVDGLMRAYVEGYVANTTTGPHSEVGPLLDFEMWRNNYRIYVFNLTPFETLPGDDGLPLTSRGQVGLHVAFHQTGQFQENLAVGAEGVRGNPAAFPFSMTVIGYSSALVQIGNDRSVKKLGFD